MIFEMKSWRNQFKSYNSLLKIICCPFHSSKIEKSASQLMHEKTLTRPTKLGGESMDTSYKVVLYNKVPVLKHFVWSNLLVTYNKHATIDHSVKTVNTELAVGVSKYL
jgi:hypothetical protein